MLIKKFVKTIQLLIPKYTESCNIINKYHNGIGLGHNENRHVGLI